MFVASQLNNDLGQDKRNLITLINANCIQDDGYKAYLMKQINDTFYLQLTAMRMFDFDKRILLPFASSVITFSVLFIEMGTEVISELDE